MKLIRITASICAVLFATLFAMAARPSVPVCSQGEAYEVSTMADLQFCGTVDCFLNAKKRRIVGFSCLAWCCPESFTLGIQWTDCVFDYLSVECCTEGEGELVRVQNSMITCPEPPSGGGGGGG